MRPVWQNVSHSCTQCVRWTRYRVQELVDCFSENTKRDSPRPVRSAIASGVGNRCDKADENGGARSHGMAVSVSEVGQLKQTVENMHGGTATLAQAVPVREVWCMCST